MSPTNIVKIVLGTKDMTQEETKNLIKSYTDEDFTIERFEIGEEQTTVIIVFNNVEAAKNFVGAIETPSNTLLTSISFLSEVLCSFSPKLQPLLVLALAASFLLAL